MIHVVMHYIHMLLTMHTFVLTLNIDTLTRNHDLASLHQMHVSQAVKTCIGGPTFVVSAVLLN